MLGNGADKDGGLYSSNREKTPTVYATIELLDESVVIFEAADNRYRCWGSAVIDKIFSCPLMR